MIIHTLHRCGHRSRRLPLKCHSLAEDLTKKKHPTKNLCFLQEAAKKGILLASCPAQVYEGLTLAPQDGHSQQEQLGGGKMAAASIFSPTLEPLPGACTISLISDDAGTLNMYGRHAFHLHSMAQIRGRPQL